MTLIQRLILEAGTMVIIVLGVYALTPVFLLLITAGHTEKSDESDDDEKVQD